MDDSDAFKVPSLLPQDLQIIQELVGRIPKPEPVEPELVVTKAEESESITSSSDGEDSDGENSETEVEAGILAVEAEESDGIKLYVILFSTGVCCSTFAAKIVLRRAPRTQSLQMTRMMSPFVRRTLHHLLWR